MKYESAGYDYSLAGAEDEALLRDLLRNCPMEGEVRVTFEREPDYFAGRGLLGDPEQGIIARETNSRRVAGMGVCAERDVFLGGQPQRGGYLSELRVHPDYRGRPALVRGGYRFLARIHRQGRAACYLTSIVSDNVAARRLLESGLRDFPHYARQGEYVTLIIPTRPYRRGRSFRAVPAEAADRDGLYQCLQRYYPRYAWAPCWGPAAFCSPAATPGLSIEDFTVVRDSQTIRGGMALWDQRAYRQIVVQGYAPRLEHWRRLLNRIPRLTRIPHLPEPGQSWAYAYLSPMAVDEDDPSCFSELLRASLQRARERRYDYVLLGLSAQHPLLPLTRRLVPHRTYASQLYAVYWGPRPDALPARPGIPHPEAALL